MIIGITGTMSAGKSTVTKLIEKAGHKVYDTDKMVHKYYDKDGQLYGDIIDFFGKDILNPDQSIHRGKLADRVFGNEENLDHLESLVFPAVFKEMEDIADNRDELTFFEVPLLFEADMKDFFDRILVVDADEDVRIKRSMEKGLERDDIEKRMERQWTSQEKRESADFIIENNFDLESLQDDVDDILEIIKFERSRLWIKT